MQLSAILGHASVSGLDKSELDLDDPKRVLDLRPDSGFERLKLIRDAVLGRVSECGECASLPRSHGNMPSRLGLGSPLGPTEASIREGGVFFSGEKFFNRRKVVHIGARRLKSVHKPRLCTHSNMRLHSKVPVVALFGLVHLRVSRAGGLG